MYEYACEVTRCIDGDTCDCIIDLGFRIRMSARVRLLSVYAPELSQPGGRECQAELTRRLVGQKELLIRTQLDKADKYGRILGTFFGKGWGAGATVNNGLIGFIELGGWPNGRGGPAPASAPPPSEPGK